MRKVAVLGSNSFSGAHFVSCLLRNEYQVLGISRSPESHEVFLPYKWSKHANGFRFYQMDVNRDSGSIVNLLNREKPSYIVNFAAQSMVAQSWENPDHWLQTNVVGMGRLIEAMRQMDFLDRYVHVSTPEIYGNCQGYVRPDHRMAPSTPYAVSRAACDLNLLAYFQAYKFPVVFTRAANVFGPGQQLYRIVPKTILSTLLGQRMPLHGGGHSERSFIHIEDVCSATTSIMTKGSPPSAYHIATEGLISIRDLVARICDRLGRRFEDVVEIAGERLGKDLAYMLDSSSTRSEFDWKERYSLDQGIDQTIEWVERNIGVLREMPQGYVHKA